MPSLLDVAKEAHVAASTVSRALSGHENVSHETSKRVQEAARRIGYQFKPAGRPRKIKQKHNIGIIYAPYLVVNGTMVSFCREWIRSIREAVATGDHQLEIISGSNNCTQDSLYQHWVEHQEVQGLILVGLRMSHGYHQDLLQRGVPFVAISDRALHGEYSSVYADLYGGSRLAAEHLISLGHRRIAILGLPQDISWSARERYAGAMDVLHAHGLKPVLDRQGQGDFNNLSAFDAGCQRLLDAGATGVICGDYLAVRYIEAFHKRGIRVPEDISFIGFDNTGLQPQTGHELSTIGYDKYRMGQLAMSLLMKLMQGNEQLHHLEASVHTSLIVRQTTGKPPTSAA